MDGGYHRLDEQVLYDQKRTNYINKKGYDVVRFWNEDVLEEGFIEKLTALFDKRRVRYGTNVSNKNTKKHIISVDE